MILVGPNGRAFDVPSAVQRLLAQFECSITVDVYADNDVEEVEEESVAPVIGSTVRSSLRLPGLTLEAGHSDVPSLDVAALLRAQGTEIESRLAAQGTRQKAAGVIRVTSKGCGNMVTVEEEILLDLYFLGVGLTFEFDNPC